MSYANSTEALEALLLETTDDKEVVQAVIDQDLAPQVLIHLAAMTKALAIGNAMRLKVDYREYLNSVLRTPDGEPLAELDWNG